MINAAPDCCSTPPSIKRPNVILVGLMGTGKSAVGRQVADGLKLRFVDTDDLVVMDAGMRIPDIFELEGEEGFRVRESAVLKGLANQQNLVIATGGGIVTREENRTMLKDLGFVIWLTASIDTLYQRVAQNRERPLLHTPDPRGKLQSLMEARRALYAEVATLTVDTTELTVPETVHGLVESVRYHFACGQ